MRIFVVFEELRRTNKIEKWIVWGINLVNALTVAADDIILGQWF